MIKRTVWLAFGLLCVASATYWVLPDADLSAGLQCQGLLFGASGLVALCLSLGHVAISRRWSVAAAGVGVFGVPLVAIEAARGSVGQTSRSALFAMVPVVVVLSLSAGEQSGAPRRLLIPSLVGLGGLLLLLPLDFSSSVRGQLMLALLVISVILVGLCSVWLHRLLRGVTWTNSVAVIGIANASFLLVCSMIRHEFLWNWSALRPAASLPALVDLAEIPLIVWLLREMPPARFAARYLAIPLLTIFESFILLRPEATVRMVFGTLLLAVGMGMLLLLRDVDHDAVLSLR